MQLLTGLEIEPFDRARDRRRRTRAQGFLHRPEGLFLIRRVDQDHARRIDTETIEAVSMRAGEGRHLVDWQSSHTHAMGRHDDQQRAAARHAAKKRGDEAERGWNIAVGCGGDLVQGRKRQTALWQMGIQRGKAEGKGARVGGKAFHARQQAAQFMHHLSAGSGQGNGQGHGTWLSCQNHRTKQELDKDYKSLGYPRVGLSL
jgi:hypothetical protein